MTDTAEVFDKRFAFRIGDDGKPVFRRLRDMTADQVFGALWLYRELANRWQRAAEPFMEEEDLVEPTSLEEAEILRRRAQGEADLLNKSARASKLYVTITDAALSVIPPEVRESYEDTPLLDLLRRYWPGAPAGKVAP